MIGCRQLASVRLGETLSSATRELISDAHAPKTFSPAAVWPCTELAAVTTNVWQRGQTVCVHSLATGSRVTSRVALARPHTVSAEQHFHRSTTFTHIVTRIKGFPATTHWQIEAIYLSAFWLGDNSARITRVEGLYQELISMRFLSLSSSRAWAAKRPTCPQDNAVCKPIEGLDKSQHL